MVAAASALGLGWALFGDHLAAILGVDHDRRAELDRHITDVRRPTRRAPLPPEPT